MKAQGLEDRKFIPMEFRDLRIYRASRDQFINPAEAQPLLTPPLYSQEVVVSSSSSTVVVVVVVVGVGVVVGVVVGLIVV